MASGPPQTTPSTPQGGAALGYQTLSTRPQMFQNEEIPELLGAGPYWALRQKHNGNMGSSNCGRGEAATGSPHNYRQRETSETVRLIGPHDVDPQRGHGQVQPAIRRWRSAAFLQGGQFNATSTRRGTLYRALFRRRNRQPGSTFETSGRP